MENLKVLKKRVFILLIVAGFVILPSFSYAQTIYPGVVATTSLILSICGNEIVDDGEECDVLGETGGYSTTILGRQCGVDCFWDAYCGDTILQTTYGEECDDGNNDDGDFCSSTCTIEPAGSGGGGGSGGGNSSSGGSDEDLGDTQISVSGKAYPGETVHILLDGSEVGSVRTNSSGGFDFTTEASPGTVSMGFWAEDSNDTKSITLSTTFDVTQGAITNVNGILLPPTLRIDDVTINPGDTILLSGQALPDVDVEIHFNDSEIIESTTADSDGAWNISFNTGRLSAAEHTVRARYVLGSSGLKTESSFSTTLQLFVGVDGSPTTPSDLNRDGFVNLIDFSILIFWWGTNGGESDPPADINGNAKVGLEDFSILLFNWTG